MEAPKATPGYHDDIFLLYRAGVLTGNDSAGTFTPNAAITRCEVATIAARMVQPDARRHLAAQGGAIQPLGLTRQLVQPQAVDGVEPYSEYWFGDSLTISADLSGAPALAYSLTFSDRTKFPAADQLPAGYDPEALRGKLLGGIFPVVSYRNACFLNNEVAGIRVCGEIVERYRDKSREEGEALALEISAAIARETAPFVDGFYLMTPFQRVGLIARLLDRLRADGLLGP